MSKAEKLLEVEQHNKEMAAMYGEKTNMINSIKKFANAIEPLMPAGRYLLSLHIKNRVGYLLLKFEKPEKLSIPDKKKAGEQVQRAINYVIKHPAKFDVNYVRNSDLIQSIQLTIPNFSRFEQTFSYEENRVNRNRTNPVTHMPYQPTGRPAIGMRTQMMPHGRPDEKD